MGGSWASIPDRYPTFCLVVVKGVDYGALVWRIATKGGGKVGCEKVGKGGKGVCEMKSKTWREFRSARVRNGTGGY